VALTRRLCLDTSAYVHFRRGRASVVELLDLAEWVGVPAITVGELTTGFLLAPKPLEQMAHLDRFLAQPVVEEIPLGREVATIYAEIVVALRRAGTPVPTNDIWIAAAAAHTNATVLTCDGHFRYIQRASSLVLPVTD
jgi:tRNA(fMet)-specific endonuclease VapC